MRGTPPQSTVSKNFFHTWTHRIPRHHRTWSRVLLSITLNRFQSEICTTTELGGGETFCSTFCKTSCLSFLTSIALSLPTLTGHEPPLWDNLRYAREYGGYPCACRSTTMMPVLEQGVDLSFKRSRLSIYTSSVAFQGDVEIVRALQELTAIRP